MYHSLVNLSYVNLIIRPAKEPRREERERFLPYAAFLPFFQSTTCWKNSFGLVYWTASPVLFWHQGYNSRQCRNRPCPPRASVRCGEDFLYAVQYAGLPWWLSRKESTCQSLPIAGRMGLIPGLGRSPWRRKWQPTSVFWPGKSRGQRSLVGYSP